MEWESSLPWGLTLRLLRWMELAGALPVWRVPPQLLQAQTASSRMAEYMFISPRTDRVGCKKQYRPRMVRWDSIIRVCLLVAWVMPRAFTWSVVISGLTQLVIRGTLMLSFLL